MPSRTRIRVVVADKVRLEDEVITDAMGQVAFEHFATSAALRSDDIVFSLRKIEPVLRSLVELEADLRCFVVLWEVITSADEDHVAFMVSWRIERIGHQPAERSCGSIGPRARPVEAAVHIQLLELLRQVESVQIDSA